MSEEIQNENLNNSDKYPFGKPQWYVVHTISGYENKVAEGIENMMAKDDFAGYFFRVIIPMVEESEIKDNEEVITMRKAFPGYVLVEMVCNEKSWYWVRNMRGVTGFVSPDPQKPIPLPLEEVRALNIDVEDDEDEFIIATNDCGFKPGERVNIISGPIAGQEAEIKSIDKERQIVKVKVSMFGRDVDAELEYNQVELIG